MGYIRSNEEWDERVASDARAGLPSYESVLSSQIVQLKNDNEALRMALNLSADMTVKAVQDVQELKEVLHRISKLHEVEDWYEEGDVIKAALAKWKEHITNT